jgi:cytochrome c-type biogenesis protein CcmH
MGLLVVVALAASVDTTPRKGVSDERLFALSARLKCLQCVGESVAASQAPLAVQFREEIRSQMRAGATDDEILNFFADRYGREVLLTPPASGLGGLVWVLPVVAVAAAVLLLAGTFRRWRAERGTVRASEADEALVAEALSRRHRTDPDPGIRR